MDLRSFGIFGANAFDIAVKDSHAAAEVRQILRAQALGEPVGERLLQSAPLLDDGRCLFGQHERRLAPVAGDGLAEVIARPGEEQASAVREAADNCPVSVIAVEE